MVQINPPVQAQFTYFLSIKLLETLRIKQEVPLTGKFQDYGQDALRYCPLGTRYRLSMLLQQSDWLARDGN